MCRFSAGKRHIQHPPQSEVPFGLRFATVRRWARQKLRSSLLAAGTCRPPILAPLAASPPRGEGVPPPAVGGSPLPLFGSGRGLGKLFSCWLAPTGPVSSGVLWAAPGAVGNRLRLSTASPSAPTRGAVGCGRVQQARGRSDVITGCTSLVDGRKRLEGRFLWREMACHQS